MKLYFIFLILALSNFMLNCKQQENVSYSKFSDSLKSEAAIVTESEPGEKLIVKGKLVDKDNKPVESANIYAYQTDVTGVYSKEGNSNPRLKGYLKSGINGEFIIHTIIPGSYPNSRNPKHIHFEIKKEGFSNKIFEIVFEGDQYLTDSFLKSDGVLLTKINKDDEGNNVCEFEIKMK